MTRNFDYLGQMTPSGNKYHLFGKVKLFLKNKSVHISGIEWSISFFTNEVDMLERKRVKTNLLSIYFDLSVKRLTSWL